MNSKMMILGLLVFIIIVTLGLTGIVDGSGAMITIVGCTGIGIIFIGLMEETDIEFERRMGLKK